MTRPLLIIKTGSAEHLPLEAGDFEDWIRAGLNMDEFQAQVCHVEAGESLPSVDEIHGVVVTGSIRMVTERLEWSERTASWLRGAVAAGQPILGICYGHQLLAHALGGTVAPDPRGREIGTVAIHLTDAAARDPLLGGCSNPLPTQVTHSESVVALPEGAVLLGSSDHTPIHAFRFGDRAWGVQFHPEFDAEVLHSYVRERAEVLRSEGLEPEDLHRRITETPEAFALLARFAGIVAGSDVARSAAAVNQ